MSRLDLHDARSQIAWARQRGEVLHAGLLEFQPAIGARFVVDDDKAQWSWQLALTADRPLHLCHLAGELLGAVRSALDYTAWQLYLAGGGKVAADSSRDIVFPIAMKPGGWAKRRKRSVPFASASVVEAITAAQPFHSPSSGLTELELLATLNNSSKHRLLTMAALVNPSAEMEVTSAMTASGLNVGLRLPAGPVPLDGSSRELCAYVFTEQDGTVAPRKRMPEVVPPPAPAFGAIGFTDGTLFGDHVALLGLPSVAERLLDSIEARHSS